MKTEDKYVCKNTQKYRKSRLSMGNRAALCGRDCLCYQDRELSRKMLLLGIRKEPLYFESKRTVDDYAFGMFLNGYPAVVMEVPKAIIINNTKIRES